MPESLQPESQPDHLALARPEPVSESLPAQEPDKDQGDCSASPSTEDYTLPQAPGHDAATRSLPEVPGYAILGILGRGGMGVVYKALQVGLSRLVALKMILSGRQAGPYELARFRREAEVVARLRHPNIVQIYEIDVHDGQPYFSLEYCSGGSLDRKLAGQAMPAAEAIELAITLAQAMHAAHQAGIVHRDLKPANILLTAEGQAKIADFGLASTDFSAALHGGASTEEVLGGTLAYMAPEHLDALNSIAGVAAQAVDQRSDIYSLGLILFELLTGRRAFANAPRGLARQEIVTILAAERRRGAPSPAQHKPDLPRVLDRIVRRCLEPDPNKRYQSARELAAALVGCRDLWQIEREMPPAGPLTRAAVRHAPFLWLVVPLLPHVLGAVVDFGYNTLWLAAQQPHLLPTFLYLIMGYCAAAFPLTGWISYRLVMPVWRGWRDLQGPGNLDTTQVRCLRQRALRLPVWGMVLSGLGWLPGGVMLPALLSWLAGPVGWEVPVHFFLSFTIAGLIALTYNALAAQFLVLRVVYPQLWVDAQNLHEIAHVELKPVQRRLRLLPILAGLVPLTAGVSLMLGMVGTDPEQAASTTFHIFQILVIALMMLGMAGCWLAVSLTVQLRQALAALMGGEGQQDRSAFSRVPQNR